MDTANKYRYTSSSSWPESEKVIEDRLYDELSTTCLPIFKNIIEQERLDEGVLQHLGDIYLPLAAWLANKHIDRPILIGINGAQGSGKSTLSKILQSILSSTFNKEVVHLSIDDLYLSRDAREKLASNVHPLLKVRGVPGTHDVLLGKKIISKLLEDKEKSSVKIPAFNKAEDDLYPEEQWNTITCAPDIVLFEGWCVGSQQQHESELLCDINVLEECEDPDGTWRNYVNRQLAGSYQSLFAHIDYLLMLKVPDMESVFEWRSLQEKKLADKCFKQGRSIENILSDNEVSRFIMHYERITRATLHEMPDRADVLLELDKKHQVCNVKVKVTV